MVRHALHSVKNQTYKNWKLVFIDDGSEVKGEPIVKEILKDQLKKVRCYRNDYTKEEKLKSNSVLGSTLNTAIKETECDIVINLNDDDVLFPNYLEHLNKYYNDNPQIEASACLVKQIFPGQKNNSYTFEVQGVPQSKILHASYVLSYRRSLFGGKLRYPERGVFALDDVFYRFLIKKIGDKIHPNKIWGQLRSIWPGNMGAIREKEAIKNPRDHIWDNPKY